MLNHQAFSHYADIYLSGTLTVDFPEDIKLPILPDHYQTIILSGATVQMDYCEIERAIAQRQPPADHEVAGKA